MASMTIVIRVDEAERDELVARAARERVNVSDYIRIRLGLRGQETGADSEIEIDPQHEQTLQEQLADHERRLQALEARPRR
jgi:hypothetical protein